MHYDGVAHNNAAELSVLNNIYCPSNGDYYHARQGDVYSANTGLSYVGAGGSFTLTYNDCVYDNGISSRTHDGRSFVSVISGYYGGSVFTNEGTSIEATYQHFGVIAENEDIVVR